jgi:hypothetical protein
MEFVIWALAGWCGTPYRPRIPTGTTSPPQPDPWVPWKVAGIIGGIGLGFVASHFAGPGFSEPMPGIIGAFIGGRVLGDIVDRFMGR